jgi:hypothetical protein
MARPHALNAVEENIRRGIPRNHPAGAQLQCPDDIGTVDAVAQNDGPYRSTRRGDLAQCLDGGLAGPRQREQENLGRVVAQQRDHRRFAAGAANDEEIRLGFEQPAETLAEDRRLPRNYEAY